MKLPYQHFTWPTSRPTMSSKQLSMVSISALNAPSLISKLIPTANYGKADLVENVLDAKPTSALGHSEVRCITYESNRHQKNKSRVDAILE